MKPTIQQQRQYLQTIGFSGKPRVNVNTLIQIVEKHIQTFPFETINLHDSSLDDTRSKIDNTDFTYVYNHVVVGKRGGHCVALNTLLQTMLTAFGFDVKPIAPDTIWQCADTPIDERTKHCAGIVKLQDQEYLIDAGFGSVGLLSPILLKPGESEQFSEKFRIIYTEDYPYELQLWDDQGWHTLYGVTVERATKEDYKSIDRIQSDPSHDDCHFSSLLLCTKPFTIDDTHSGRYRICNNKFSIYQNDKVKSEKEITNHKMLSQLLKKYFGINLGRKQVRFQDQEFLGFHIRNQPSSLLHSYPTRHREKNATLSLLLDTDEKPKPAAKRRLGV
ncbi:MAG: arylamine N-acetyltransferase [Gammaproteobacteria bacterium]|jgi:N-hydroxyarylamine O-acetyltransferase|nr:arylamine N-acetyltransferase [Gammaproteobacteria bacterium]